MPTLVASYFVQQNASTTNTALTTPSFTPSNGEVIVVKLATWDTGTAMGAPTGGSQTYTSRVIVAPGGFRPWNGIYTAVISGSPGSMTISSTPAANARYSMCVERWSSASLAATPVTNSGGTTNGGSGAAASTLTTSAANSVISWVAGDAQSLDPATRAYLDSATDEGVRDGHVGSNGVDYHAWQNVAAAGSTSFGLSAPTGMQWDIAGIEVLDASGGAAPAFPPSRLTRRRSPQMPRTGTRSAGPARAQLASPIPTNPSRPSRVIRGLLPRRSRTTAPVPAQVVIAAPAYPPNSVRTRLRGLRLFRPRIAGPVPAQVIVAAPAYPPPAVRIRLRGLRLFRPRAASPVPAQVIVAAPTYPLQVVRARLRGLARPRPRVTAAIPSQVLPVAPLHRPGRPPPARRGRAAAPPIAQPAVPASSRQRSRGFLSARRRPAGPVPPQTIATAPAYVPGLVRVRQRLGALLRRGRGTTVVPGPTATTSFTSPNPDQTTTTSARDLTTTTRNCNVTTITDGRDLET